MGRYAKAIIAGIVVAVLFSVVFGMMEGATGGATWRSVFIGFVAGAFTAYIMGNLTGTKAGPAASDAVKQAALSPVPPEGRARIIVCRQGFVAMAAGLNISIDGSHVAQIKSPQWTAVEVAPGAHSLKAAFTGLAEAQSNAAETAFELKAGEVAVFRLTLSMGALKNTVKAERIAFDEALTRQLAGHKMVAPTG